jgi:predicted tellurium resistance membrane protein TerC
MSYFSWFTDPRAWVALVTLTFLQIVLGIDNIVLLTILAGQLEVDKQDRARRLGLIAAMTSRLILLCTLLWIASVLEHPLFKIGGLAFSGKDLILVAGGLFLISKATTEIHHKMEGDEHHRRLRAAPSLNAVLAQIFVLDILFSLDSVITAVGMVKIVSIQIIAVVLAAGLMMVGINTLAKFVDKHPTIKMLALSFLVLIGVNLVAEGFGFDIPRGYTYFAMAWSVLVEMLNLRFFKKRRMHLVADSSSGPSNPAPQLPSNDSESTTKPSRKGGQAGRKPNSRPSAKGSSSRRSRR